jgi:predicted kinase
VEISVADGRIILIAGNMAAGKSSVAQALAERLPRSVHLRGDLFRRMIVRGQAEMDFELSPEAERQLWLRYRLAAAAAREYAQAGFTVVYQDVVVGPMLAEVAAALGPPAPDVVVLCPRAEAVAAREAARAKTGYPDLASVAAFDRLLREGTPRIGLWLDTSDMTLAETVDAVAGHLGLG